MMVPGLIFGAFVLGLIVGLLIATVGCDDWPDDPPGPPAE